MNRTLTQSPFESIYTVKLNEVPVKIVFNSVVSSRVKMSYALEKFSRSEFLVFHRQYYYDFTKGHVVAKVWVVAQCKSRTPITGFRWTLW